AGFSAHDADELFHAAPMHDIGKIGVPDKVLLKPGPLNDEEWIIMRRHPQIGAEIIGQHTSPLLQMAYTIALTHHEKWDGSGYPYKLKGEQIPMVGRIVALVDVFDALTTARPYKHAWPVEEAVALLQRESGRHFDPNLVPVFLDLMPEIGNIMQEWAEDCAPAEPTNRIEACDSV
ncbi:MAG: HD domain-containing protein, partial [Methylomonas sp.]|nr:HD domain-containing protein [Methylomonas sp.]